MKQQRRKQLLFPFAAVFTLLSHSSLSFISSNWLHAVPQRHRELFQKSALLFSGSTQNEQEQLQKRCEKIWPHLSKVQDNTNTQQRTFTTTKPVALNEAIAQEAGISFEYANELIEVGAVSIKGAEYDEMGEYLQGSSSRWRHVTEPTAVEEDVEVKVFLAPRLYPACYCDDWEARLLHESEDMIIVDKPAMLPCQPHQSNYRHSAPQCAKAALYSPRDTLYLCHRLDTVTEGCLVLGRSKAMVHRFGLWSRQGVIFKEYLALTTRPVEAQLAQHHMYFGEELNGPKLLRRTRPTRQEKADWKVCKMDVLGSEEVEVSAEARARVPPGLRAGPFYEVKCRLVTGRTHQVRAQLAALGAPIVGDDLYWPMAGKTLQLGDGTAAEDEAVFEGIGQCAFPAAAIGLQASRVFLPGTKGVEVDVRPRPPWWRLHR